MFHRVKSEGQDAENPNTEKMEEATLEVAEESAAEAPDEELTAELEDNTTQTPVEDTEEMTTEDNAPEETSPAIPAYQQRPTAAPSSYPGAASYAGGYNAPSSSEMPSASDRRLTIGAGITMSGEIESCDYLLVEGTVEAALKGANVLEIAESGTFYGTVEIGEANIAGRFEGDITVHGRLTLSSTGTVTGTISYKELEIEAGAVIDGKLTPLSAASAAAPKKAPAAKKAPAKKPKANEAKQPAPANSEGGLFSKAAAE